MDSTLRQYQSQSLQQRLSPMQVQFVRLLEMTPPEVEAEVARKLDELPALEVAPDSESRLTAADSEGTSDGPISASDDYSPGDDDYNEAPRGNSGQAALAEVKADPPGSEQPSLAEWLESQLGDCNLSPDEQKAARQIIGNLDGNGYLRRSLQSIADDVAISSGEEIPMETMERAFGAVRSLDPAGVGAEDLRDCLLLQLDRRKDPDKAAVTARKIIDQYFPLLAKKHYAKLAVRLGVDKAGLSAALDVIRHLNPKPGSAFGESAIESAGKIVVPEFLVEPEGNRLVVSLLNSLPELTVSASFGEDAAGSVPAASSIIPSKGRQPRRDTLAFIRGHREEAATFIKTLKMRQDTLFNVMTAIATIQRDFFITGDETLIRPMILKDVAALTGYNLSVISRATASKYVMTLSGVYPLKFFFNEPRNIGASGPASPVNSADSESSDIPNSAPGSTGASETLSPASKSDNGASFHQIAALLRKIVAEEDKHSPTADEAIAAQLNSLGFNIARRTVAKYRERLGIPPARLRREPDV